MVTNKCNLVDSANAVDSDTASMLAHMKALDRFSPPLRTSGVPKVCDSYCELFV